MSAMIEVFYAAPADQTREVTISEQLSSLGGRLTYREPAELPTQSVCLTYEFARWDNATVAVATLRNSGFHVEGPMDYGD